MSEAGKRLLEGAKEAIAIAKGEQPAAAIWQNGFRYVPDMSPETIMAASERIYAMTVEERGAICAKVRAAGCRVRLSLETQP